MSKTFYDRLGKTIDWPNFPANFPPAASITYDDVLIVPGVDTKIISRKQPDLSVQFGPYKLTTPIVSAPMDTVSGESMVRKLAELGAIGSLPRSVDFNETLRLCEEFSKDQIPCLYAISYKNALKKATELKKRGAKMILLDVAHGGMELIRQAATEIKEKLELTIVAGNIVTYSQAMVYKKAGIDIARVGVGPGGACKTRLVAGTGFPQLSALFETTSSGIQVIADGGIRYSGDAAKALVAGASVVMIGSMFAGTEETPGKVIDGKKKFRGQASTSYMKDHGVEPGQFRASEGIDTNVLARGSVEHVIADLTGGIRSTMSYVGATNLHELQLKGIFTYISASVQAENKPHILSRS